MDEVAEGAEGLLDVDGGIGAVHLVEVDPVRAESAERVLDLRVREKAAESGTRIRWINWRPLRPSGASHRRSRKRSATR